jgi:mRNA-degrading endonuclease RelE of RelBE toxin-antitoxin system
MDHIEKLLRALSSKHRAQILETVACIFDPRCRGSIRFERLSGTDVFFTVHRGRYRIIVRITDAEVEVMDIRLRNEKTYRDF